MASKDDAAAMFDGARPPATLRPPVGLRLSTDTEASHVDSAPTRTKAEKRKKEGNPRRVNRGYALDLDLVAEVKAIAARQHRPLYEAMEDALRDFIGKNGTRR